VTPADWWQQLPAKRYATNTRVLDYLRYNGEQLRQGQLPASISQWWRTHNPQNRQPNGHGVRMMRETLQELSDIGAVCKVPSPMGTGWVLVDDLTIQHH